MTDTLEAVHTDDSSAAAKHEQSEVFETQCINLLCKQENKLAHLSQSNSRSRTYAAIDLTKHMLVDFLEFAESQFDDEEFGGISAPLRGVYDRVKEHEKRLNARSLRILWRMLGIQSPNDVELCEHFQQLRNDYLDLYRRFFAICAAKFEEDSARKADFLQSVDVFLDELTEKW